MGHLQNPVSNLATICFEEAGGSESRLCEKTPCKSLAEARSLVPRNSRQVRRRRTLTCQRLHKSVHMLIELSPTIALSDLVRDIKQGSSKWAKQQVYFPQFSGWGKEYGAFSVGQREKDVVVKYIIISVNTARQGRLRLNTRRLLRLVGCSGMTSG